MSKIGDWFKAGGLDTFLGKYGSLLATGLGYALLGKQGRSNLMRAYTGSGLTDAQLQQNEYNSNEAALNRQFQADQRATTMQTAVADYKAAGVNPAVMFGNALQPSAPAGGQASGAAPTQLPVSDAFSLLELPAKIQQIKADTAFYEMREADIKSQIGYRNSLETLNKINATTLGEYNQVNIEQIRAAISNTKVQEDLARHGIGVQDAMTIFYDFSAYNEQLKYEQGKALKPYIIKMYEWYSKSAEQDFENSKAEYESIKQGIRESSSRIGLNRAMAEQAYAMSKDALSHVGLNENMAMKAMQEMDYLSELTESQQIAVQDAKERFNLNWTKGFALKFSQQQYTLGACNIAHTIADTAGIINDGIYKWVNPLNGIKLGSFGQPSATSVPSSTLTPEQQAGRFYSRPEFAESRGLYNPSPGSPIDKAMPKEFRSMPTAKRMISEEYHRWLKDGGFIEGSWMK